jgi:hypothetical protein
MFEGKARPESWQCCKTFCSATKAYTKNCGVQKISLLQCLGVRLEAYYTMLHYRLTREYLATLKILSFENGLTYSASPAGA